MDALVLVEPLVYLVRLHENSCNNLAESGPIVAKGSISVKSQNLLAGARTGIAIGSVKQPERRPKEKKFFVC